jgi:hypothetical protein
MATLLRIAAVLICATVVLGFLTFAVDESDRASKEQVASVDPTKAEEARAEEAREGKAGPVKEAIYDVDEFLLAPFDNVTDSRNVWVQHLVPTALGLLAYGLGLLLLANYLPKPKRRQTDWRAA